MKFWHLLFSAALALGAPLTAALRAQAFPWSPPPVAANREETARRDLNALMERVQARLDGGISSEAQLTEELKALDALSAKYAAEKTDAVASIAVVKALLYVQVFDSPERALPIFRKIAADFPGTQTAAQIPLVVEELERTVAIKAATALGREFPPFKETAADGAVVDLTAYRGKVVLVNFWATWCPPCLAELPEVKAVHAKYHAQGFEIIGISLDQDGGKLAAFVRQHKMPWPQLFDGKAWGGKLVRAYGIRAVPSTFLLDRHGNIAAKNLHGAELSQKIAELLAAKP